MSKKDKRTLIEEKVEGEDIEFPTIALVDNDSDVVIKVFKLDEWQKYKEGNLIRFDSGRMPGFKIYRADEGTITNKLYIFKKDIENRELVKCCLGSDNERILDLLGIKYWELNDDVYIHKSKIEELNNLVNTSQQAYTVKGTDYPYFFKINGRTIKSDTSSWFKYLYDQYDYMPEAALEPYNGEDKCEEHRRKDMRDRFPFPFPMV